MATSMKPAFGAAAALAALLSLAGCQKPAEQVVATPTETPAPVATPIATADPFAMAVSFQCEGGGELDVAFNGPAALARLDGGAPVSLNADTTRQDAMAFTNGTETLTMEGSGVTWKKGADMKTCQEVSKSLPAPTAEGVLKTFTIDDKDPAIALKVGEKFAIALVGVPTAGYVWGAEAPPAFVKVSDGPGGPTSSSQFLPGFAGGNHWEVVIVEATAAGEGEVNLVQKRPWEDKADPDASRYKVKVKATAN